MINDFFPFRFPVIGYKPETIKYDSTQMEECLVYEDHNVLVEGLPQAQNLTNSIILESDNLPESLRRAFDSKNFPNQDKLVHRSVIYNYFIALLNPSHQQFSSHLPIRTNFLYSN